MSEQHRQKTAIFCIGISGSGKTTWAKQFILDNPRYVIISRDDIRASMCKGGILDWSSWNWKWEKDVTKTQLALSECYSFNQDLDGIIIADTNLSRKALALALKCKSLGYQIQYKEFDLSLEECIVRDSFRGKLCVGESVIRQQYSGWLEYKSKDWFMESGYSVFGEK